MRIQSINFYNNGVNPTRKTPSAQQVSATDVFVKSPAFRNHNKLMPFFEGSIKYTPENLKKFNSILETVDLSGKVLHTLMEKALDIPENFSMASLDTNKLYIFNYDFLIRNMGEEELVNCKLKNQIFQFLPAIQYSDDDSHKVEALIAKRLEDTDIPAFYLGILCDYAMSVGNLHILKTIFQNGAEYLKKFVNEETSIFTEMTLPYVKRGRNSSNPKVQEFFSGDNVYNIYKAYSDDTIGYAIFTTPLAMIEYIERVPSKGIQNRLIDEFVNIHGFEYKNEDYFEHCAKLAMSSYERKILLGTNASKKYSKDDVQFLMEKRIENIVQRNGLETNKNLLNCLKDKIMSEEILTQKYQDTTLIEEIAKNPFDKEIMDELSNYSYLKDNESYRNAAIIAAKQGNVELLKFFDSRHIHYANNLSESLEIYPKEVQEILANAKISYRGIFQFAENPEYLSNFLENNPHVDINTLNENGETLLMVAAKNQDIEMFSFLVTRDDMDLNMIDNYGENVLMQMLNKPNYNSKNDFKKKAIEILRELPPERFDINYVNYMPTHANAMASYSALSKLLSEESFYYSKVELDLLPELLKFPNIDTNFNPIGKAPLAFVGFQRGDKYLESFESIFFHPNTNSEAFFNIDGKILEKENIKISQNGFKAISKCVDKKFFADIKEIYDENGFLTLYEIEKFVSYEGIREIASNKINVFGENIGHLLAETVIDENNLQEMRKLYTIFSRLKDCGYDFNSQDDFGVTPLAKAIECQNKPMEFMFKICS